MTDILTSKSPILMLNNSIREADRRVFFLPGSFVLNENIQNSRINAFLLRLEVGKEGSILNNYH